MTRRAGWLLGVLATAAVLAPWLAPYDPEASYRDFLFAPPMPPRIADEQGLRAPFVYPVALIDRLAQRYDEDRTHARPLPWFGGSAGEPVFLLGADSFGRDVLSRLLHGTRVSLALALASVLGALVIGTIIGGVAGYVGGWIDDAAMRAADFVIVLPIIYVVLLLRAVLPLVLPPAAIFVLMAVIFALVGWPFVARGVRGVVKAERARESVLAARSLGANTWGIFRRHLLPACAGHLLVQATLLLPGFILAEATLSYVGLGFPERIPTWGTMLTEAANVNTITRFPWTLTPALAIFLVVLVTNAALHSDKIDERPI
jgi:peptide/nickel transport system permease protein